MHLELVVPALLLGRAARQRLPALELLLARARRSSEGATTLEAWLCAAFGVDGEACPAGALTAEAEGGDPGEATWLRADPVHLLQQREMLVLMPPPAIRVRPEEAQALCATLNAHFGAAFEIHAFHPERWCARIEGNPRLEARAPLEAAGRNVDAVLPGGEAKRWHALLNEVQMLLHAHPVNAAREARGERPVNSLWLWGAGTLPTAAACPWQTVAADDPVACGLARAARVRVDPPAFGAEEWLGTRPAGGRHLAVLDALRARHAFDDGAGWEEDLVALEARWFAPLLGALRAGRAGMLTLHVPDADASRRYELVRGDLRRFWKRPRPLDEA